MLKAWSSGVRVLLVAVLMSLLGSSVFASHFRGATVYWTRVSGNTVQITLQAAWAATQIGTVSFEFGDGSPNQSWGSGANPWTILGTFTDLSGAQYTVVQRVVQKTYATEGPFTIGFTGGARITTLQNSPGSNYTVRSVVDLRGANQGGPVASLPFIVQLPINTAISMPLPIADPDGDPVTVVAATTAQSGITSTPTIAGTPLTVTSGGTLTWNTTGGVIGHKYAYQVRLLENHPGGPSGLTSLDFIIELIDDTGVPQCSGGGNFVLTAGQNLNLRLLGFFDDGSNGNLTFQFQGTQPPGSTFTPPIGTVSPAPFNIDFDWTPTAGDVPSAYSMSIIYRDQFNQQATCSVGITVIDDTPPEITCPGDIIAECTSASGAVVTFTVTASDDSDPNPIVVCVPPSGSVFPLGTTTVVCTATDDSNLSSQCSFDVTVEDTTAPSITCPGDISTECTGPGGTVVTYSASATDVCDPSPSVVCAPPSGSAFALGTTMVTCTATDDHGNSSQCSFDVTIVDTTAPSLTCASDTTVECEGPGGTVVFFTSTATDLCDPNPVVGCFPPSGTLFPEGTTQVTCTATDDSGNSTQCFFDVTVVDTTAPDITCPADVTVERTTPAGAVVSYTTTASDDCDPSPTIVCAPISGSTFPLGTTTVLCTATDASGNSSQCSFDVTVEDTTAPDIVCPADITVERVTPAGSVVTFTTTATDNSDPSPTIVCVPDSGSTFAPGTTTVLCTATDASGNSSQCSFDVTVEDTTAPDIVCPADITVERVTPAGSVVTFTTTATDNSDPSPTIVCVPDSGSTFAPGTTTVLCTATDASGNSSQCSFDVTVEDTTAPDIVCPADITVERVTPAGSVVTFTTTATDNSDPSPTIVCVPDSGSTFAPGTTTVLCTATDASGNSSQCSFDVTVEDTTAPDIVCPADITVERVTPAGSVVTFTTTATDNSDPSPTIVCVPDSGSTFAPGTTTVLCTATDASGNSSQCSFDVTVEDTTAPDIVCPEDITVERVTPAGSVVTFTTTATDNSDPSPTIVCVPDSGSTFAPGTTTVLCTATDASGNSSQCSFDVTVEDTTAPDIVCPADITVERVTPAGSVVTFVTTATDNSDPAPTIVCVPDSGSTFPPGTTTVVCTATDASGNSSQCSFDVTVEDTTAPDIVCPDDITVERTSPSGNVVSYPDPIVTDISDPAPVVVCDPASGSLFAPGTTLVTCTATDASGNSSECTFSVTVEDTTAPEISCPGDIMVERASHAGTVVSFTTTAVDVSDPAPEIACTPPSGTSFPLGTTTVVCTATDDSGNSSVCSFDVTVVDTTPPVIDCPGFIWEDALDPSGLIVFYDVTATDSCDPAPSVVCEPPSGTLFPIGTTQVFCTATDSSGNTDSCNFGVTVAPPECYLVIGDGPGTSPFAGFDHMFTTLVGPVIEGSHEVLMDVIPEFVLPPIAGEHDLAGVGLAHGSGQQVRTAASPAWLMDGEVTVQILMWNPQAFPALPEQSSAGLYVLLLPDGSVTTSSFGTGVGNIQVWTEVGVNEAGQRVLRFPFFVEGL